MTPLATVLVLLGLTALTTALLAHLGAVRAGTAAARHAWAVTGVVVLLLLIPACLLGLSGIIRLVRPEPAVVAASAPVLQGVCELPLASARPPVRPEVTTLDVVPFIVLVWALGAAVGLGRLAWRAGQLLKQRRALAIIDPIDLGWLDLEVAAVAGLGELPPVLLDPRSTIPMVVGFHRPAIVVPAAFWLTSDRSRRRDILIHECAHVMRGDAWWALAAEVAASLWWFLPPVAWLGRRMAVAREELCDQIATQDGDVQAYARSLVEMAEGSLDRSDRRLVVAALRSGELAGRIVHLVYARDRRLVPSRRLRIGLRLAGMTLVSAVVLGAAFLHPPAAVRPVAGANGLASWPELVAEDDPDHSSTGVVYAPATRTAAWIAVSGWHALGPLDDRSGSVFWHADLAVDLDQQVIGIDGNLVGWHPLAQTQDRVRLPGPGRYQAWAQVRSLTSGTYQARLRGVSPDRIRLNGAAIRGDRLKPGEWTAHLPLRQGLNELLLREPSDDPSGWAILLRSSPIVPLERGPPQP